MQKWHCNFSRPGGSWNIDQTNILCILFNHSRTTWSLEILMPFLIFSDNALQDAFQKCVGNFEIAHKTCSILVWGVSSA